MNNFTILFRMNRFDHTLNDVSETGSNSSPVTSSRSSPYLTGGGGGGGGGVERSRHDSQRASSDGTISGWLKDIRLHKYTESLSKYTWEQVRIGEFVHLVADYDWICTPGSR